MIYICEQRSLNPIINGTVFGSIDYCTTNYSSFTLTQVEDFDHRISQDPAEKMWESHRILQENTEIPWNTEAVFRPEIVRIFSSGFLSTSCAFRQEPATNHWKKSEKISGLNTASMFQGIPVFSDRNRPVLIDLGRHMIDLLTMSVGWFFQ
jgi:hypothetical protein